MMCARQTQIDPQVPLAQPITNPPRPRTIGCQEQEVICLKDLDLARGLRGDKVAQLKSSGSPQVCTV